MSKHIVIVESPAKAKTIGKFLGDDYLITASYGHVRDLPSKKLGVDVENNFEPDYTILKDKSKIIKDLKKLCQKKENIFLATDPDREGEAIAWHLEQAINVVKSKIKRIEFNEITKPAIQHAIENSRDINENLVNAQQARRILDRLIGYKLSPILSKKIRRGLSAGRVQSVAVKLICDREKIIDAFIPEEYWLIDVDLIINNEKTTLLTRLFAEENEKNKCEIANKKHADAYVAHLNQSNYHVKGITKKGQNRNPYAPFITSTLQQDASRKLNWSTKRTMIVAQQLYEGVEIHGEATGLITYMRTDSTRIAPEALHAAKDMILTRYGKEYALDKPRVFKQKKNIQDAHEAIRPAKISLHPSDITSFLTPEQAKLYKLIWDRFIASQMAVAKLENTQVVVAATANNKTLLLKATGSVVIFDGFTVLYQESVEKDTTKDTDKKEESTKKQLPRINQDDTLTHKETKSEQKFTQPPARYTEASLVKEMEEQGIGRPSTYAPTLSTIQDRGYVEKTGRSLSPSELGGVVNEQLEKFFHQFIEPKFTANMETQLDEITEGKHKWQDIVSHFYTPFTELLDKANDNMEKIKYGERDLGIDPKTQKPVYAKIGRYGPLVQLGEASLKGEKPQFSSLLPDQDIKEITLENALELLSLPKTLGQLDSHDIQVAIGRYGPYVKYQSTFASIPKETPLFAITLDEAITLIKEKQTAAAKQSIKLFDEEEPHIKVLNGRYGPYISIGKQNIKIPKDVKPEDLTREQCLELQKNAPAKRKRKK